MLPYRILEDLARVREQDIRRDVQRRRIVPESHENRLWLRTAGLIRRARCALRCEAAPPARRAVAQTACCS